jgi:VanZ family protein
MRTWLILTLLRLLTWACVIILAIMSLTPGEKIDAVRTNLPGQVEHIIAYAGATAIAMAGYGLDRHPARIIGWFWLYAGVLEFLQNFSPGRDPKLVDFAASAVGALCGGLSVVALWHVYAARPSRRAVQGLSSDTRSVDLRAGYNGQGHGRQ